MSIEAMAMGGMQSPVADKMAVEAVKTPVPPTTGEQVGFQNAVHAAGNPAGTPAAGAVPEVSSGMKTMFNQLERVNGESKQLADFARSASASGKAMTPGEIVQLTVRCQEFMFHCQLTSNIANRTSDGVQQLFKQQG